MMGRERDQWIDRVIVLLNGGCEDPNRLLAAEPVRIVGSFGCDPFEARLNGVGSCQYASAPSTANVRVCISGAGIDLLRMPRLRPKRLSQGR